MITKLKILIIIILLASPIFGKSRDKIQIVFQDQIIEEWTYDEFEALIDAANFHNEILKAEEHGRVTITLEKDPWQITDEILFSTDAIIRWYKKDNRFVLKEIVVELHILKNKQQNSLIMWISKVYTKTARIGFPVTIVIIILGVLLI